MGHDGERLNPEGLTVFQHSKRLLEIKHFVTLSKITSSHMEHTRNFQFSTEFEDFKSFDFMFMFYVFMGCL